jgi:hypothetical protein
MSWSLASTSSCIGGCLEASYVISSTAISSILLLLVNVLVDCLRVWGLGFKVRGANPQAVDQDVWGLGFKVGGAKVSVCGVGVAV